MLWRLSLLFERLSSESLERVGVEAARVFDLNVYAGEKQISLPGLGVSFFAIRTVNWQQSVGDQTLVSSVDNTRWDWQGDYQSCSSRSSCQNPIVRGMGLDRFMCGVILGEPCKSVSVRKWTNVSFDATDSSYRCSSIALATFCESTSPTNST